MLGIRLDASQGERRLKGLLRDVNAWSGQHAEVHPTFVMEEISRIRGETMLAVRGEAQAAETYRRMAPRGKALLEAFTKGSIVSPERVASFWRYCAYVYVERTAWPSARDGEWGRDKASTISRKRREYNEAQAHADETRDVTGRSPGMALRPRARRPNWAIGSYGVRAPETSRRWYRVQKGQQQAMMRHDRPRVATPVEVVKTPLR